MKVIPATENRTPCPPDGRWPTFAIFTLPKPFLDPHIECIQRNAIASWRNLGSAFDVILIGDDAGVAEAATELEVRHAGSVDRNSQGTPLLNSAFEIARSASDADVLIYCNADVILLNDFKIALKQILQSGEKHNFMAIGRRTNLDVDQPIDFSDRIAVKRLLEKTKHRGKLAPVVCKEYFAFGRDLFNQIPPFAVGRGNWDNWMVADTKRRGVPVIDLSQCVTAIHQNHDYHHVDADQIDRNGKDNRRRKRCYLAGAEARENQRLAGGKHIVSGSTTSHRLTYNGVEKLFCSRLNLRFWADLPRFARLVYRLFLG